VQNDSVHLYTAFQQGHVMVACLDTVHEGMLQENINRENNEMKTALKPSPIIQFHKMAISPTQVHRFTEVQLSWWCSNRP